MRTTYILDTSVLAYDPYCYKSFSKCELVIPVVVLEELDKLKTLFSEAGKNARIANKVIEEISSQGDIVNGVTVEDDVVIRIDVAAFDQKNSAVKFGDPTYGDTQILHCAHVNWLSHINNDVTLISNDINLRIKARALGMKAEDYTSNTSGTDELYSGNRVVQDLDVGLELQQKGFIDPRLFNLDDMNSHECALFEDEEGNGIAMGRKVNFDKLKLVKKVYPWGVSARNKEQSYAIDLIMDRGVDLVTLVGKAGSGKTLVALASALELVLEKREYDRLVIYRPIQSVGNDIGFLPGEMSEKLAPWFQAVMDSFEFLFGANKNSKSNNDWKRELEMYQKKGKIELEAITYIRGRSIPNAIILVDEAQNLSPHDIKTILTRAGTGTKIILTGDIEQIDNPKLSAIQNGLTHVIDKFKDCNFAGHITFTQGERSRLASFAAEVL